MAGAIGFFLGVRIILMVLAVRVFGMEPQSGTAAVLLLNILLLTFAASTFRKGDLRAKLLLQQPAVRWSLAFLFFSGISLLYTVALSIPAAVAFWCAMAADWGIVWFTVRDDEPRLEAARLMRGFVQGACFVALVAWVMPSQSDLRLGDEELLGPNQIGFLCATALFFAQYLMREREKGLLLPAVFLSATLLRSLSKTTIIAFVIAEVLLLVRDRSLSRKTKLILTMLGAAILLAFAGLLADYVEVYLNRGNESVTLTGRVTIWAFILNEAVQQPWIGHGFHSVWKVIPPLNGGFEARHAHNELLQQFYSYGVAGVVLLVGIYWSFYRQIRQATDPRQRLFLSSLLIFILIRGLTDTEVFDLSLPVWEILLWSSVLIGPPAASMAAGAPQADSSPPSVQLSPECNF